MKRREILGPDRHGEVTLTPDARYVVVEGKAGPRLWRASNPNHSAADKSVLVSELMAARRLVRAAHEDAERLSIARAKVDEAKRRLGERGPPWWDDDAPDFNRRLVKNTPYAEWWSSQQRDA